MPEGHLRCLAPPTETAGEVDVLVTLNGVQYTHEGSPMRFRYLTEGFIFVSAVSPRLAP